MSAHQLDSTCLSVAAPVVTWEYRGRDIYARVDGGTPFYVARRTHYGQRIGLTQSGQSTGPSYDPAGYIDEYGVWATVVCAIGASESGNRFNCVNTYDRAAFTFGFFQLAAHTPDDNLVLLLRRATALPAFQRHFPQLAIVDGRLHLRTGDQVTNLEEEVYNPWHREYQLKRLMRYLNPNESQVDEAEIIHVARLVDLCKSSPEFCALQVGLAVEITARKFRERYQRWYDLDGASDSICVAIADIHHQGRAKKAEVRAALASTKPLKSLMRLGEGRYPERCRSLYSMITSLEQRGQLGIRRYMPDQGCFVA